MSITEDRPETLPGSRVTSKGQVTIPKAIREKLGVKPGDEVVFVEAKGRIALRKRTDPKALEAGPGKVAWLPHASQRAKIR